MKKIILALFLTVSAIANAQENKTTGFVEFQTDIAGAGNPNISLKGGFLTPIDTNIKLGAGIGVTENTSFNNAPNIPVFGRAEFLFKNVGNVKPFIDFDLGYSLSTDDLEAGIQGAFFLNPTIGVHFNKFYIGAGYMGSSSFKKNSVWGHAGGVRIGYTIGGAWKDSALQKFFKRTKFGLDATAGIGVNSAVCNDEHFKNEYSGFSSYGIGFHWLYSINEKWAAGIGAQYCATNYKEKYTPEYSNSSSESDKKEDDLDAFVRVEYTHDQLAKDVKPFAAVDLGASTMGGMYLSPQVGVKFKDSYRAGLALESRSCGLGDEKGSLTLCLRLGVDL